MGRLALRVLDNMQLDIKNVHVRFEDRLSNPERPFAAGIFCRELSLFTTNANFKKAIRDRGISKQEYTHKSKRSSVRRVAFQFSTGRRLSQGFLLCRLAMDLLEPLTLRPRSRSAFSLHAGM